MQAAVLVSPQRRVAELDPQQVPHTSLGRIVNNILVVEKGVTGVSTHPCLHPRPQWHCDTIPEKETKEYKQILNKYLRIILMVLAT